MIKNRAPGSETLEAFFSSVTLGDFLINRVNATRSIEPFVGKTDHSKVLESLKERVTSQVYRIYKAANGGIAGETELLTALINREEWAMPKPNVKLAVYSDFDGTLFNGRTPIMARIELLIRVQNSKIPVRVVTGASNLGEYQGLLNDISAPFRVFSKMHCDKERVHILIDDSTPEEQERAPIPDIYIPA